MSLPCRLLLISQAVIDIRNTYATLYDRIMKNYDKLMREKFDRDGNLKKKGIMGKLKR